MTDLELDVDTQSVKGLLFTSHREDIIGEISVKGEKFA